MDNTTDLCYSEHAQRDPATVTVNGLQNINLLKDYGQCHWVCSERKRVNLLILSLAESMDSSRGRAHESEPPSASTPHIAVQNTHSDHEVRRAPVLSPVSSFNF